MSLVAGVAFWFAAGFACLLIWYAQGRDDE